MNHNDNILVRAFMQYHYSTVALKEAMDFLTADAENWTADEAAMFSALLDGYKADLRAQMKKQLAGKPAYDAALAAGKNPLGKFPLG